MRKLLLFANALIAKDKTWAAAVPTRVSPVISQGESELIEDGLTGETKCHVDNMVTQARRSIISGRYTHTKVNRRPPSQADIQQFLAVVAPSVHQMLLSLERRGLLRRTPGQPRSLEVLVAPEDIPVLR